MSFVLTVVLRALLPKGDRKQGVGAEKARGERGSSRPGQAELPRRQQPPCPADLIYAACPMSATSGRVVMSGRAPRRVGPVGSPGGQRWPELSTLDRSAQSPRRRPDLSAPRTAIRRQRRITCCRDAWPGLEAKFSLGDPGLIETLSRAGRLD